MLTNLRKTDPIGRSADSDKKHSRHLAVKRNKVHARAQTNWTMSKINERKDNIAQSEAVIQETKY